MSGIEKWCTNCGELQYVKVLPPDWNKSKSRNFNYSIGGELIHFFQRNLCCLKCGNEWYSAEVKRMVLKDLIDSKVGLESDVELMQEDLDSQKKEIGALKTSLSIANNAIKSRNELVTDMGSKINDYIALVKSLEKSQQGLTIAIEQKSDDFEELTNALKVIMKHVETEEV